MSILEGELAETIGDALLDADIPLDVVVTRSTPGEGPPWDPGPPTLTDYECRGFVDTFSDGQIAGGLIETGDVKVVVVVSTLAIQPSPSDMVTVRGESYAVISVSSDPALALWEIQGRA